MTSILAVLLNDIAQLEYHRDKPLPEHQQQYLDKMDEKMSAGIQLGEEIIENPSREQRIQFVAANLANAVLESDEALCSALTAYLANRVPDLKQIKLDNRTDELSIELVFDAEYQKQVQVKFFH